MLNFLPHTDDTRKEMLKEIGLSSIEELFSQVPQEVRVKDGMFNLPAGISEQEAWQKLLKLAGENKTAENS
ncbi:MAG: hypothetical protein GX568_05415, partial [Candidatus Gastranaerophilales bacterium]|nr:hypothetical protein [Candidatus Gastranaerophilales bacterium]